MDNKNIKEKHLGKRGLHLNAQANAILASKILSAIRNQERSLLSDLAFSDIIFIDDNLSLDNNVNIVKCNNCSRMF